MPLCRSLHSIQHSITRRKYFEFETQHMLRQSKRQSVADFALRLSKRLCAPIINDKFWPELLCLKVSHEMRDNMPYSYSDSVHLSGLHTTKLGQTFQRKHVRKKCQRDPSKRRMREKQKQGHPGADLKQCFVCTKIITGLPWCISNSSLI